MGELSSEAKTRLAYLEFYQVVRDVSLTCRVFKISRETFYKWKRRYDPHHLSSLENHPRTPKRRRQREITYEEEMKIKHLREKYLRLGKRKLAILYQQEYPDQPSVSEWKIQKTIEKHNLYYDPIKAKRIRTKKKRNKGKKKIRINQINPQDYLTDERPFFFCTDTIVLYLPWGVKRYILTAIDYFHKVGYARGYKTASSLSAFDFLLRLNLLVEGKISAVLSDNGSEFSKYFEEACQRLKITHIFTRIRTPKDNAINERFNRTLKEEFIETNEYFEEYLTEDNLNQANKELTEWLIFYNFKRPHQSLAYQTPVDYTYYTKGVSAMHPPSTVN